MLIQQLFLISIHFIAIFNFAVKFPLPIGGYSAQTLGSGFDIDSSGNLAITGTTYDLALSASVPKTFLALLGSADETYKFAITMDDLLNLYDIQLSSSNSRIGLIYSLPALLLVDYTGQIVASITISTLDLAKGPQVYFHGSLAYYLVFNNNILTHISIDSTGSSIQAYTYTFSSFSITYLQGCTVANDNGLILYSLFDSANNYLLGLNTLWLTKVYSATTTLMNPKFILATYYSSPKTYIYGCKSDLGKIVLQRMVSDSLGIPTTQLVFQYSGSDSVQLCLGIYTNTIDQVKLLNSDSGYNNLYYQTITLSDTSSSATGTGYKYPIASIENAQFYNGNLFYLGNKPYSYAASFHSGTYISNEFAYVDTFDSSQRFRDSYSKTSISPAYTYLSQYSTLTDISSTLTISSTTISSTTLNVNKAIMLTTAQTSENNCMIQAKDNSTDSFQFYPTITQTFTLTSAQSIPACTTTLCTQYYYLADPFPSVSSISATYSSGVLTVSTPTLLSENQELVINYVAKLNTGLHTNCLYYYRLIKLTAYPIITIYESSSKTAEYVLGSGDKVYSFDAFSWSSTPVTSTSSFSVCYNYTDTSETVYATTAFLFIASASTTSPSLTLSSSDPNILGISETIHIRGYFQSYNPGYLSNYITYEFNLVEYGTDCPTATITRTNNVDSQVYVIGQSALVIAMPTYTISKDDCGTINFSGQYIEEASYISNGITYYYTNYYDLDSTITIDNTAKTMSAYSNNQNLDGTKTIIVYAKLETYINQTQYNIQDTFQFSILFISTALHPITPGTINNAVYYTFQSKYKHTIGQFTCSGFGVEYQLVNQDETSYDSSIFTFDNTVDPPGLYIYTTDETKLGTYNLRIKATYAGYNTGYWVTKDFSVTIYHMCAQNLIKPPQVDDIYYEIGDQAIVLNANPFQYNISECSAFMVYKSKLTSGTSLPGFINFDVDRFKYTIYSIQGYNTGTFTIHLNATSQYYHNSSVLYTSFIVQVNCTTKKLYQPKKIEDKYYQIGQINNLQISFNEFKVFPKCVFPQYIKYYSNLIEEAPLPSFIKFDDQFMTFTVSTNQDIYSGAFGIIIKANQTNITNNMTFNIIVKPQPISKEVLLSKDIQWFAPMNIDIQINQYKEITSDSFKNIDKTQYYMLNINNVSFVQFGAQKLIINSTNAKQGTYTLYLYALTAKNEKYVQTITITLKEFIDDTGPNVRPITGSIKSISRTGDVIVKFNQDLEIPSNISNINSTALQLTILDSDMVDRGLQFSWSISAFAENKMQIKLTFDEPLDVSPTMEFDKLQIVFLEVKYFKSATQNVRIPINYKMIASIPKQLDKQCKVAKNCMMIYSHKSDGR